MIKTSSRAVKAKDKLILHKSLRVPIDGLMAEEIPREVPKKKPTEQNQEPQKDEDKQDVSEEPLDKKDRKKQLKQEKRDKRKLKKELKVAFKTQQEKVVKVNTTEVGGIKPGVSVKKIY